MIKINEQFKTMYSLLNPVGLVITYFISFVLRTRKTLILIVKTNYLLEVLYYYYKLTIKLESRVGFNFQIYLSESENSFTQYNKDKYKAIVLTK